MRSCRPKVQISTCGDTTIVRRVSGSMWDTVHLLCRPDEASSGMRQQARAVYEAMLDVLAAEAPLNNAILGSETLFLKAVGSDQRVVAGIRHELLHATGLAGVAAEPTWIGQPPLGGGALELMATVLVPHENRAPLVSSVTVESSCRCSACHLRAGQVMRIGGQTMLRATNLCGRGKGAFEEAYDMFRAAKDLVEAAGMEFGDVVRTWIYLRDIDRDYDELNRARRAFFRDAGIERMPASTGVSGAPADGAHDFSMALYAVKSDPPPAVAIMSTPTLNEAWAYGSDFSRGLRVSDANRTTLYISGTASIDENGETVHIGDAPGQVRRMLRNIETLLEQQGAGFSDLVAAVTYVKDPRDADVVRAVLAEYGFDGFPNALVEAPLCRPELLCEAEAVAVVPRERRV